ncbi:Predicted phospholipase, patatin/cPLA2 family [Gracilibacillus ureilyticus]|uniref:Predicted phospholipase, patatin/cPLA2 family n=1 Tax=Gracilibacillus ureilyticus TaxID=531814 RepID=A0A1H9M6V3_9BACI|nr:patatin family protein [Gracilibacillus ureilyticus]SER19301.1 Predicted phospholipase, patatin/cPLA2 family [Gracilibacillus ureilyticus]
MKDIGLVLEGGGSRGVYTAGILQFLMEKNIYIPYVVGVSAGACNGSSYISRQMERNKKVTIDYVDHPEYLSLRNFIKKRQLFGMDFIFDTLPNSLVPFDFETFNGAAEEFVVGVTDCYTGESIFYHKSDYAKDMLTLLRASSSLPFVAPAVDFHNRVLMDGGITAPIPIKQSIKDGNHKNVVILTRNRGYYKKPQTVNWYMRRKYREYPGLLKAIAERHMEYNETLNYLFEEEKKGNVFIICPTEKLTVGRVEKNKKKLTHLYEQGYQDVERVAEPLHEFLS